MTSGLGGRVVLLVAASMVAASCSSNSSRNLNSGDAGKAGGAEGQLSGSAGGAGGKGSSGTTGGSTGSGGRSSTTSGSAGSGGSTDSGRTSSSGGTGGTAKGSGGSGGATTGSGGSGGATSGSAGTTAPTGGSSAVDAGARDGSAGGATNRDAGGAGGRDAAGGRAGAGAGGGAGRGAGGATVSSTGSDGCTDSQAANLTLQQVAVYQSVKIPIMTDGTEVAAASRKNAVVQGRDTMFRVFVTLNSGWTTRDLSARLTLTPSGGQGTQYYAKKTVSASSTDASLDTTFQIYVPASAMTDSLRYSVSVVECGTPPATAGTAQFPASGDTDLGVKNAGGLKITIVPMQVGTLVPDTSQATLDLFASQMMAMYPISAVSFTVAASPISVASPIDWTTMLDQLRAKRTQDKPASDVYYFGLVKPASTLRTYCQTSCTTGIGFVVTSATQASGRAAVGIDFVDSESTLTMAHEVGHNHGRSHAPCAPKGLTISGVDSKYPYTNGALGSWGWDGRTQTLLDPAKATDLMGYCSNQWMSDYTYAGITTRVQAINGTTHAIVAGTPSKWRVLLIDDRGPRWGVPIENEVAPEGEPEMATIYDNSGAALTSVEVYRTEIGDISASMVWVPEPKPDWYAVEVIGAAPHPFAAPVTVPRP